MCVVLQVGTLMAGTDKFYIHVAGVGGHGGTPHLVRDTVVAASAVVMNLQPLISRETDPAQGGIVGVTLINSGKLCLLAIWGSWQLNVHWLKTCASNCFHDVTPHCFQKAIESAWTDPKCRVIHHQASMCMCMESGHPIAHRTIYLQASKSSNTL